VQAILVINNPMPLCFRSSRSDSTFETLHYIPGTTLLGGLATAYSRMKQGSKGFKDEFARFFTGGKIRFGNLYPANFKDKDESKSVCDALADNELPVRPIPATARSCKRFDGFLFQNEKDDDDEKKHGVFDALIPWALFSLSNQEAIHVFDSIERCSDSDCKKQTKPFSGFYRRNSNAVCASKAETRMVTRAGISRQRGAVMQKILYHREILCENQKFWGILDFQDDTLWDDFESFVEDAFHNESVYLGNNKTRGMGKVGKSQFFQITEPLDTLEKMKQRVEKVSALLKETAENYHVPVPHTFYIPITLQSDVILRDRLMRYHSSVEADYLEKEWNLKGMELIYRCTSSRRVMGWNAFAGLPKADDMAIAMGSVFLFGFTGNADDTFWQRLFDIQVKGIGERRQEGFGNIVIAEPFHTEVKPI